MLATRVGVVTVRIGGVHAKPRKCARCGCELVPSGRSNTPLCRDCRSGDPAYIKIINMKGRTA